MRQIHKSFARSAFALVILFLSGCMTTQLPDTYQVEPEVLEAKGGKVDFKVTGTIPEKSFHKKAVVEFTPYLKYKSDTMKLRKFVLRGEGTEGEGTVINSKTGGSFTYEESFDYVDEMHISELFVNTEISKGNKLIDEINEVKLADGVIATYKNNVHDEKLSYAPSGYEKENIMNEAATLYFKVNMANVNMNLPLNKSDKTKADMNKLHEFLMKGWEIKEVNLDGWASPEGEISFNGNLANDRASSAKRFMEKHIKQANKKRTGESDIAAEDLQQEISYNTKGHGEDWDGFMKAVKQSDIKDKNEIINIVNSESDASKREQEMRNMTLIYKKIENEILPPLRRAEILVSCFEPKRTDEEIEGLAISDPGALNYKEILHAATLTDDHEIRYNIYKAAIENKDKDWKAYNNAAVEAIELNKLDEAANYLVQAGKLSSDNGAIENNLGVTACRKDDYSTAEQHFMNAQKQGENVNYNMGVIMIQKGEYDKANNYFKGDKCNHNVGLAQLLSGRMNEAMLNLKCAPENPETFYLLAVYGARKDNQNMVVEYLAKAIKMDSSLKDMATTDREFKKYYNLPAFVALLK